MTNGKQPVEWVDPLIDTAKPRIRWSFSASACRPFGMVRLSPDTKLRGTWGTGYCYGSNKIRGFSHIHAWQLAGIPIMPITGPLESTSGSDEHSSRFSHQKEIVHPGYHSVMLDDYAIRVELTATRRVGFHRYTFPKAEQSYILLNLGADLGPCKMSDAMARKVSHTEIEGYVENDATIRRPKPCRIYFVIRFNKPFKAFGGWTGNKLISQSKQISGKKSLVFLKYATSSNEIILLKVALSYVSIRQARLNLNTELPHWKFDRVRNDSSRIWNEYLGKIEVEGGSEGERRKFYTDLWRSLLGGHLTSDVNGKYSDMTGKRRIIRQVPLGADGQPKYPHINPQDCFWGAHWSLSLLLALVYPKILSHYCNFLVDMYRNGGLIPRGPCGGNYSFVMISAHSTAFIVAAYTKGIRDFDIVSAYKGMRKNAFPGGLMSKAGYEHKTCKGGGIEYYIQRGYIPEGRNVHGPFHVSGAAQTLEYAYDDWCLSQMAKVLNKENDYQLFIKRAQNYRNLFDPSTRFMRPRNVDGSWLKPFNPLLLKGWCEANAWQYTWYVPHDVQGLIQLMGGAAAFTQKLNFAFEKAVPMDFYAPKPQLKRDSAYINYGNEPGRFVAHLFNHCGAPWLAQKWTRLVKQKTFSSINPVGFCEDDDQGLAAATSVMLAIGLFDVRGGAALQPIYEITSPIFHKVTIHLDKQYYSGERFVIRAQNNSAQNMYIQSVAINGKPLNKPWFYHRQLIAGGNLLLKLGPKPNKQWSSQPDNAPPSMSSES